MKTLAIVSILVAALCASSCTINTAREFSVEANQTGRFRLVSNQFINDRGVMVIKDSSTGKEYIAVCSQGCGVTPIQ